MLSCLLHCLLAALPACFPPMERPEGLSRARQSKRRRRGRPDSRAELLEHPGPERAELVIVEHAVVVRVELEPLRAPHGSCERAGWLTNVAGGGRGGWGPTLDRASDSTLVVSASSSCSTWGGGGRRRAGGSHAMLLRRGGRGVRWELWERGSGWPTDLDRGKAGRAHFGAGGALGNVLKLRVQAEVAAGGGGGGRRRSAGGGGRRRAARACARQPDLTRS